MKTQLKLKNKKVADIDFRVRLKNLTILKSLRTTSILTCVLMGLLLYGVIVMPLHPSFKAINSISLFEWMWDAPVSASWWLYAGIAVLVMLVLNTVVCSIESVIRKWDRRRLLLIISPQVIHAGFCFIMLAHLLSAYGSFHEFIVLQEGQGVRLDPVTDVRLKRINYGIDSGYITDMSAEIAYRASDNRVRNDTLSPNNPSVVKGIGVYLKEISLNPVPRALIEFSYEPGALWALAGGILFLAGTLTLVVLKLREGQ